MVEHAQRFDRGLQGHLVGLQTRAERERMTRHYLSGGLNRERLRTLEAAGPRRRAASRKRPAVAERRCRLQQWMLTRYAELGVFQRVLDEADEMQRLDPDAWRALARCDSLSAVTLTRYSACSFRCGVPTLKKTRSACDDLGSSTGRSSCWAKIGQKPSAAPS
jgi:hypothetical protein